MNIIQSFREFLDSSKRVLVIAKKPDKPEYFAMIKVIALGIVIISMIGYVIFLIFTLAGM